MANPINSHLPDFDRACLISTSREILKELAASGCEKIRARVAENESTPPIALKLLMRDRSSEVRASVAGNPRASKIVLHELASDCSPDVRFTIAENPHTSIEILIGLAADENPYVAIRAEKTIEAIVTEGSHKQGRIDMSTRKIENTVRRMLHKKERLNKRDALRLRDLILADGYLSRAEKKVMVTVIENDLLDHDAFEIFREVLLQSCAQRHSGQAIA